MNIAIVDDENRLITLIANDEIAIVKDGFEIINFGNNEPVLEDIDGEIFIKKNSFVMDLTEGAE